MKRLWKRAALMVAAGSMVSMPGWAEEQAAPPAAPQAAPQAAPSAEANPNLQEVLKGLEQYNAEQKAQQQAQPGQELAQAAPQEGQAVKGLTTDQLKRLKKLVKKEMDQSQGDQQTELKQLHQAIQQAIKAHPQQGAPDQTAQSPVPAEAAVPAAAPETADAVAAPAAASGNKKKRGQGIGSLRAKDEEVAPAAAPAAPAASATPAAPADAAAPPAEAPAAETPANAEHGGDQASQPAPAQQ